MSKKNNSDVTNEQIDKQKQPLSGYALIFGYMGIFIFFAGLFMLVPLFVLIFYPEEVSYASYFIIPGMICVVIGYVLKTVIKGKKMARLAHHEDTVLVLWCGC